MRMIRAEEILYQAKTYGVVAWKDDIYVLSRLPYLDWNDGHAYYANAFRIGDEIQDDGSAPNYKIVWENPYPPFRLCYKKFISKDPGDYEVFLHSQITKRKPSQVLRNGIMCPYGFKATNAKT